MDAIRNPELRTECSLIALVVFYNVPDGGAGTDKVGRALSRLVASISIQLTLRSHLVPTANGAFKSVYYHWTPAVGGDVITKFNRDFFKPLPQCLQEYLDHSLARASFASTDLTLPGAPASRGLVQ